MRAGASNSPSSKIQSEKAARLWRGLERAFRDGLVPRAYVRWEKVDELAKSIRERGLLEPVTCVLLDGELMPVHGVHRLAALMKMGWLDYDVPIVVHRVESPARALEVALESGMVTELSQEELFAVLASHDYVASMLDKLRVDREVADAILKLYPDLRQWLASAVVRRGLSPDSKDVGPVISFKRVAELASMPKDRQRAVYERVAKELPDPTRAEASRVRRVLEEAVEALEEPEGEERAEVARLAPVEGVRALEDLVKVWDGVIDFYHRDAGRWAESVLEGVDRGLKRDVNVLRMSEQSHRLQALYWRRRCEEAEERLKALEAAIASRDPSGEVRRLADEVGKLKVVVEAQAESLKRLKEENDRLRRALEESGEEELRKLTRALMAEVDELRRENARLHEEVARLIEENERLRRENEELKARLRGGA